MTMLNSLSPKQYAQLLYWPIAVASLFLLSLPTMGVQWLMATNRLPFLAGWFVCIPTLSGAWLIYIVLIQHLQRWAATKAVLRRERQLHERGMFSLGDYIASTAERAEWKMLTSMALLFGIHIVFVKPETKAQMRDVESPAPAQLSM